MTRVSRSAGYVIAGLVLLAGCTSKPGPTATNAPAGPELRLVAFDSCADLLQGLRTAARTAVGPYGFGGYGFAAGGRPTDLGGREEAAPQAAAPGAAPPGGAAKDAQAAPDHSGTNTHEPGVDEPDLVKTDGRRIVSVSGGVLRVVDAASHQVTGSLRLDASGGTGKVARGAGAGNLLLAGDRALVLVDGYQAFAPPGAGPIIDDDAPMGPQLLLVDLAGGVRVAGRYAIDGALVDARQVGGTVRVVVRSTPRIEFAYDGDRTETQRIADNQAVIDKAPADAWLPRYVVDDADGKRSARVDCTAVSRPTRYTGTSLLTVLTFDLGRTTMGNGQPVSVAADGETVYSNGASLYVANYADRVLPVPAGARPAPARLDTELYKFDTADAGKPPRFVAAGTVPGFLLNQYSLSEWQGFLRVATTTTPPWMAGPVQDGAPSRAASESGVYVLRQHGRNLVAAGHVGGLGRGERIYAVRFLETRGYVVTFRQTDPLYTLDLRDPSAPKVAGELKINGYSAYLHPAGDGRLLGVGQDATDKGRVRGTQISLFDVTDPAHTARLAQYQVRFGHSEAEFDPHAFLYWPAQRLLVVPMWRPVATPGVVPGPPRDAPAGAPVATDPQFGALALKVQDGGFTDLGTITHPTPAGRQGNTMIRRSLVIGDTLWTISDAGLAADHPGKDRVAWLPFG
jgi:hypothetical protein